LHATECLQGVNHRMPTLGLHVLVELLVEPLEACGVFGHRTDIFLEHDVLCGGRTDDLREPSKLGGAPILWTSIPMKSVLDCAMVGLRVRYIDDATSAGADATYANPRNIGGQLTAIASHYVWAALL
jgi:hypothetical protein